MDRPYDQLTLKGEPAPVADQVRAALAAVPNSTPVGYELPATAGAAARVVVRSGAESIRVYVHPETLAVLHQIPERDRFMRQMFRLHGELLMGDRGSHLVELAASWTIVMLVTGLYLWWPRQTRGWGGVLYPRLFHGQRVLWRDTHSVVGIWISAFALFLLVTGLPWAKFWGEYFKTARRWTGTAVAQQDWTTGSERSAKSGKSEGTGEHAGHSSSSAPAKRGRRGGGGVMPKDMTGFDRVAATVRPLGLAAPVVIAPPSSANSDEWTAKSMAANRPLRVNLVVTGKTGEITSREDFGDRHLIDRLVGIGIAAHEGQLFGWTNQLLGLLTALGLVLLSVSGVVMWWRRRESGVLGAPRAAASPRWSWLLVVAAVLLGVYLPLFGASLIVVLLLERLVLRRLPRVNRWLGLVVVLLCVSLVGCGPKPTIGGTPGVLRSGTSRLSEMQVTVHRVVDAKTEAIGYGVPDIEGQFRLIKTGGAEPLVLEPGDYRCTVESIGAPLAIPKEFSQPESTPWKIAWQGGAQTLDLELPAMKLIK